MSAHDAALIALQREGPQKARLPATRAVEERPDKCARQILLGIILLGIGESSRARRAFRRAAALEPGNGVPVFNHADTVASLGGDWRPWIARALFLEPGLAPALFFRGMRALGRDDEEAAITDYVRAVAIDPRFIHAVLHIGVAMRRMGREAEGLAYTEHARTIGGAADPMVLFNIAGWLLCNGRLEEGWRWMEARWRLYGLMQRHTHKPRWDGIARPGTRVCVWGEQGVGDVVNYACMLKDMEDAGQDAVVEVDPRLVPLLAASFPKHEVRGFREDAPDDFDAQMPIGSLASVYRRSMDAFPRHAGYLRPRPEIAEKWRRRVAALPPGLRVGVTWRSSNMEGERFKSYAPLGHWRGILSAPGVSWVCLQYDGRPDELDEISVRFGCRMAFWRDVDLKDDFEDVAALIGALDLVIAGPNAMSDIAGAVGQEVWVPTAQPYHFLYHGRRDGVPWYPSMRLFAKRRMRDSWGGPMGEAAAALRERIGEKAAA